MNKDRIGKFIAVRGCVQKVSGAIYQGADSKQGICMHFAAFNMRCEQSHALAFSKYVSICALVDRYGVEYFYTNEYCLMCLKFVLWFFFLLLIRFFFVLTILFLIMFLS